MSLELYRVGFGLVGTYNKKTSKDRSKITTHNLFVKVKKAGHFANRMCCDF